MHRIYQGRTGLWLGRILSVGSAFSTLIVLICMLALPLLAGGFITRGEKVLSDAGELADGVARIVTDAENALLNASEALEASASAIEEASLNLAEMEPLLESIQDLLGEEAPRAIVATQRGLDAAQSGARAMDQMLRVLSSLRFLTGVSYAPEQPLDESLQVISEDLVPLPAALIAVSDEIETFGQTLDRFEPELSEAAEDLGSLAGSLRKMSSSISTSADTLDSAADALREQAQKLERRVWIGVAVAEILLLHTALLQLASGYIGAMLLREHR